MWPSPEGLVPGTGGGVQNTVRQVQRLGRWSLILC